MKKTKTIPQFKNEDEEREFWATHDTTVYFDSKKPVRLDLTNLKKSSKPVTIRLPNDLIAKLKILAHKRDVPYQSFLKMLLAEKIERELKVVSQTS